MTEDEVFIKFFKILVKNYNLEYDTSVVEEDVTYSSGESRKVESIMTTAKTVKAILSVWDGNEAAIPFS